MSFLSFGKLSLFLFSIALITGCGIVKYPGQIGMVTNSFNKIDFEYLDEPGLYVYETVYDNRPGGAGVGAIVTKLYPQVKTYTSNVRTNSDGTLYRSKIEYEGAQIQMISLPNLGQINLSPNHQLVFFVDYATSMDETDDKNLAETGLFKPSGLSTELSLRAFESKKMKWDLLRAGRLLLNGNLAYEVVGLEMNQIKFTPVQSVQVETSFFGNALRAQFSPQVKADLVQFIETHFPTGFHGTVSFTVRGSSETLSLNLGVNTVKTLENSGVKVIKNVSENKLQEILNRYKTSLVEGEAK
ncbi:MAG: hypothetical protein FJ116_07855 [Deltaproteobacteria bacterium]|nr:hypothetical protein [Deltaproteobacteria bacterium]